MQFFQKDLHTSRLAMENSSVSLHEGWTDNTVCALVNSNKYTNMVARPQSTHLGSLKDKQTRDSSRMDSYSNFVVQFDEEMFALEAQLANLCPAEGVDFGVSL